jgi:hypothetical protein
LLSVGLVHRIRDDDSRDPVPRPAICKPGEGITRPAGNTILTALSVHVSHEHDRVRVIYTRTSAPTQPRHLSHIQQPTAHDEMHGTRSHSCALLRDHLAAQTYREFLTGLHPLEHLESGFIDAILVTTHCVKPCLSIVLPCSFLSSVMRSAISSARTTGGLIHHRWRVPARVSPLWRMLSTAGAP